jgi:hypothetical protein
VRPETRLQPADDVAAQPAPCTIESVVAGYPTLNFKRGFTDLLLDQGRRKPNCWAANAVESGIAERIEAAPFGSGEAA